MDIRIWNIVDRFDYNEYDIEVERTDVIYQLMVNCQKLKQVKVLSKYDFSFYDLKDYTIRLEMTMRKYRCEILGRN